MDNGRRPRLLPPNVLSLFTTNAIILMQILWRAPILMLYFHENVPCWTRNLE